MHCVTRNTRADFDLVSANVKDKSQGRAERIIPCTPMNGGNPEFPSSKSVLIPLSLYIQKSSVNQRLAHSSALKPEASLLLIPCTLLGPCSCSRRAALVRSVGNTCILGGTRSGTASSPCAAIVRIPPVRCAIIHHRETGTAHVIHGWW